MGVLSIPPAGFHLPQGWEGLYQQQLIDARSNPPCSHSILSRKELSDVRSSRYQRSTQKKHPRLSYHQLSHDWFTEILSAGVDPHGNEKPAIHLFLLDAPFSLLDSSYSLLLQFPSLSLLFRFPPFRYLIVVRARPEA